MSHDNDHIRETLRALDPENYLACLYMPENMRQTAITLYAFNAEILRIPDLVSEPMPGEIRLQWWRDLIKSNGNAGSGPLAQALLEMISKHDLPREVFDTCLDAHIFDLYQDPMPDMATFEGYLGETISSFLNLIALSAGIERIPVLADACGHAGMAIGITRILSSCAHSRARGQIFLPLSVLASHDLESKSWLSSTIGQKHEAVVNEMLLLAREHLNKARQAVRGLPKPVRTIFMPMVFVEPLIEKLQRKPVLCLSEPVGLSPLKRQWVAFRGVGRL